VADTKATAAAALPKDEDTSALLQRAEQGDASALPAVRELLKNPKAVDLLGGDLARQVEYSLIKDAVGKNLAFKEALHRKVDLLRGELAGPSPAPLERLLADRAVTCWLFLHDREVRYAQATGLSITQAEHWQKVIDRAHRRYLGALKTLALVRKLALPVLQVNIARRQTNVAGPSTVAEKLP
jgi:hypothetical protein